MDVTREVSEGLKIWLCGGGILLLLAWARLPRTWARGALLGLTLLAAANYAQWGTKALAKKMDSYDVLHYFLCAKYFDQLDYYDLYPALILADQEHPRGPYNKRLRVYRAKEADKGYLGLRPIAEALAQGRVAKARFTPERWEEFRQDFYKIQRDFNMSPDYYRSMLTDRGFNGTPVWTLLAEPLAKLIPVRFIKALCFLDILWLMLALSLIHWAYDDDVPVLLAVFFLTVTYSTRWPIIGQAYSRYDWVALLLVAMGLLRKGRHFLAGVAAGLSGLLRLFPFAWLFGLFAKVLTQTFTWLRERKTGGPFPKTLCLLFAGVLVAIFVFEGAAIARFGSGPIVTHAENIQNHTSAEELSSRRMGLAIGLIYQGKLTPKSLTDEMKERVAQNKPLTLGLAALLLLGLGFASGKLRDDEAFAVGFVPFFLLTTFSYYYAVARITLVILHASDLGKLRNRVGLAYLLSLEVFCNAAEVAYPQYRVFLIGHLCWGLILYSVGLIIWLLADQRAEQSAHQPAVVSQV